MEQRKKIETEHPMRWYYFAVYFQLFAFALINVVQGMTHLTGFIAGYGTAAEIYEKYPALNTVEMIMAVLAFITAVLCLVARQFLWYFKAWGPRLYLLVMAVSGVYSFVYSALSSIIIRLPIFTAYDIGGFISTIIIVVLCYNYFKTRADLFIS